MLTCYMCSVSQDVPTDLQHGRAELPPQRHHRAQGGNTHSSNCVCVCVCVCARLCGSVCLTELKNEYTTDKSERRKLPMEWSMSEWPWATDDRGTQEGPQPSTRPSADSTESKGTIHLSPAVVTKGQVKYTFPHSNHLWKKKVKCVNVVLCLVESVGYMQG